MRYSALFGIIIGLMVFAGHPQYLFIAATLCFCYTIFRVFIPQGNFDLENSKQHPSLSFIRLLTFFIVGGIIGACIGFPQLRSTYELSLFSERSSDLGSEFTGFGSLPWSGLLGFLNPYYMGDAGNGTFASKEIYLFWEYFHYAGFTTFLLALFGIYHGWRKYNAVRALCAVGMLSYLLALGENFPLYKIFSIFPLIGSFRFQARWLLGAELSIIALAGFGLLSLQVMISRKKTGEKSSLVPQKGKTHVAIPQILVTPKLGVITAIIILFDIYAIAGKEVATADPDIYFSSNAPVQNIKSTDGFAREFSIGDNELNSSIYQQSHGWENNLSLYRAAVSILPPDLGALHGIPEIDGYVNLVPQYVYNVWGDINHTGVIRKQASMKSNILTPSQSFMKIARMWSVGYFTSLWDLPQPAIKKCDSMNVKLYSLPEIFPRAWVVNSTISMPENDYETPAARLANETFDPRTTAIVCGTVAGMPHDAQCGTSEILSADNQYLKIKADVPGLVVINDTWYPHWHATVDGKDAPVLRVNSMMRGVGAPVAGAIIEMKYDEGNLALFGGVSYFVTLASIAFFFVNRKKKNTQPA